MIEISRANARFAADLLEDYGMAEGAALVELLRKQAGPAEPIALGTVVEAEGIRWVRLDGRWHAIRAIRPDYDWDELLDQYQDVAGGVKIVDPS
jgi:hypothetical protein